MSKDLKQIPWKSFKDPSKILQRSFKIVKEVSERYQTIIVLRFNVEFSNFKRRIDRMSKDLKESWRIPNKSLENPSKKSFKDPSKILQHRKRSIWKVPNDHRPHFHCGWRCGWHCGCGASWRRRRGRRPEPAASRRRTVRCRRPYRRRMNPSSNRNPPRRRPASRCRCGSSAASAAPAHPAAGTRIRRAASDFSNSANKLRACCNQ